MFYEDSVDPLKKFMVFKFRHPLGNRECWNAFQVLVHAYASANDCVISAIRRRDHNTYVADVLIKYRGGQKTENDPFLMDNWKSNRQIRREKYMAMLRDKGVDITKGLDK